MEYILIVFICITSVASVLMAYRQGLIDGQKMVRGKEIVMFGKKEEEPYTSTVEEKKMQTLLNNIDVYDGTSRKQVKL